MEYDIKSALLELFSNAEITHGQRFDDNRRWCGICNIPRMQCDYVEQLPWKSKMCHECSAVWPEYINEFITSINEGDESIEDFQTSVIN